MFVANQAVLKDITRCYYTMLRLITWSGRVRHIQLVEKNTKLFLQWHPFPYIRG